MNIKSSFLLTILLGNLLWCLPCSVATAQDIDTLHHGKQRIEIEYAASFTPTERQRVYRWLQQASHALTQVYGEWPMDRFTLTIHRAESGSGPVPWGHVERGSPTKVLLVVNPTLGYEAMLRDWTVFHELSHLLLPYEGFGNIWLSEGLATYYQNVIQARQGLITQQEMWRRLANGFARGQRDQSFNTMNLTQVSDEVHKTRQFMRVHWSGVLYWLNADIALRQSANTSLDQVLKQLKACCEGQALSAQAITIKLDELAKTQIFVPLFKQYCETHRIPDYHALLQTLGVISEQGGQKIALNNHASMSSVREAISNVIKVRPNE